MTGQGRPTDYTEELAAHICSEVSSGRSLNSICKDEGMPNPSSVYLWLSKYRSFSDNYAKAQADRAAFFAEEIVEISDDSSGDFIEVGDGRVAPNSTAVSRDKLKVDTRKWLMSRMDPKRYGDKVETVHSGSLEVQQITRKIVDPKADN